MNDEEFLVWLKHHPELWGDVMEILQGKTEKGQKS